MSSLSIQKDYMIKYCPEHLSLFTINVTKKKDIKTPFSEVELFTEALVVIKEMR